MSTLPVIFSRSHTLGTVFIRAATWGAWSHCGIVTPKNTVIEARWPDGVVEVPMDEFLSRMSRHEIIKVACPRPLSALKWARSQLGKPYDTWGVLGLGLRRKWNKDDAWWCSELVEVALEHGGRGRFRHDLQRVTPQHSWMVK